MEEITAEAGNKVRCRAEYTGRRDLLLADGFDVLFLRSGLHEDCRIMS